VTPLKSVRICKPFQSVTRLVVGEAGIKSLTILDTGWLEIVGATSTVLRPPSEVLEGVTEQAEVTRPKVDHVPEAHSGPVSPSVGLPAGEAGYVVPQPYKAPAPKVEPSRKRGKR